MTARRTAMFILFYLGIILAILVTYFHVQDTYGRPPLKRMKDRGSMSDVTHIVAASVHIHPVGTHG